MKVVDGMILSDLELETVVGGDDTYKNEHTLKFLSRLHNHTNKAC